MYDVIIVGAGAAGLMCACSLKIENKDINVLLLEKSDKVGKKLLMTGNGRCNLGNNNTEISNYNSSEDISRFYKYLDNSYLKALKKIGVAIKEEDERLYPNTNQALSVCKSFERFLKDKNVNLRCNYNVKKIVKEDNIFVINDELKCKNLVIACGGNTYSKTGSNGDGYRLLESLGHKITNIYPSLTKLKTDYKYINELDGVRFDGVANLYVDKKLEKKEQGQIQFVKNYVSGICVFNLSRNVKEYLNNKKKVEVIIDFLPNNNLIDYIVNYPNYKIEDAISGIINNKLASAITKELNLFGKNIKDLTLEEKKSLEEKVHNMKFNIIDTGSFEEAQVINGGACLNQFDDNLASNIQSNLYAIGEVLDIDGYCGGYNLSWAFTSALIVSRSIVKNIKK